MLDSVDLDAYVICPLSEAELKSLADACGRPIAKGLRHFLAEVGMPQNVVPSLPQDADALVRSQHSYDTSAFIFFDYGESFLAENAAGQVVAGDLYAGVQEVVHADFDAYLAASVEPPDESPELVWALELSFSTDDEPLLREALRAHLDLELESSWQSMGPSRADVITAVAMSSSDSMPDVQRHHHGSWEAASYSLDFEVPAASIREFKQRFAALKQAKLGFEMFSLGIGPAKAPKKLTTEQIASQRAEAEAACLERDREFLESLGAEVPGEPCRRPNCEHARIEMSVLCRLHHFESIQGRAFGELERQG